MTTAELKEYLGMVVQVEKEVDTQKRLCQQISQKVDGYNHSIETLKNRINNIAFPSRPAREKIDSYSAVCSIIYWAIICFIIFFILDKIFALLFGIVMALKIRFSLLNDKEENEKSYEQSLNRYNEAFAAAQTARASFQKQIEELKTQKQVAETYRQQVEKALASSRRNLDKMYSYNVVFPKYRNYVMVSSLYEYLCAGRCTTLEGHEGAYNILELEIRLDRIITQLDRILQNLAAIQANQYTLYSCLQDSNRKMDMLLQEENRMADGILHLGTQASAVNARLESLQKSSELTNYLTECNQRELHYMNRMNYLAGHYDNPYGNYSPV